ncbi:hypothetical protein ACWGBH_09770 [Streptomyces massasporeus]
MTTDGHSRSGSHLRLRPEPAGGAGEEYLTASRHAPDVPLGPLAPARPLGGGTATSKRQRHS